MLYYDQLKEIPVLDFLAGVFKSDIDKICEYVDIRNDEQILEGVKNMSGLGQSIAEKALAQGIQQGIQQGSYQIIYSMVQDADITPEKGAARLGITTEQLKANMINLGYTIPE